MRAVAVVNGNARRVRGGVRARLERALPGGVRFTTSLDHARAVIRDDVQRGVDLVVLAGGDGTVVMGLALIAEACRGAGRPEPAIGILRLGSGNALADAVGASDDVAGDLERLVRGEGTWRATPLVEVLGVRAPFVGVGVDAQLLEDHRAVGRVIDRVPGARRFVGAGARYALSVALRSVPRFARGERPHAVVTNAGAPAIEMARAGPTGRELAAGEVLWRGACTSDRRRDDSVPWLRPQDVRVRRRAARSLSPAVRRRRVVRDRAQYAGGVSRRVLLRPRA